MLFVLLTIICCCYAFLDFPATGIGIDLRYGKRTDWSITPRTYVGKSFNSSLFDLSFEIPMEQYAIDVPGASRKSTMSIFEDLHDYQHEYTKWSSWSFGIPFIFSFSKSDEWGIISQMFADGADQVYNVVKRFILYEICTIPPESITDWDNTEFMTNIAKLPRNRTTQVEKYKYRAIIDIYGTGTWISCSKLGGRVTYHIGIKRVLLEKRTHFWISHQVQVMANVLDFQFGMLQGRYYSKDEIDTFFLANVDGPTCVFEGGTNTEKEKIEGNCFDLTIKYPEWTQNLAKWPTLLPPLSLKSWTKYIQDSEIRENMKAAIDDYMANG